MIRTLSEDEEDTAELAAWRAGDRGAGTRLFRRHFARVHRFFVNKTPAVADDLTQRTFLACVERPSPIRVGFRPYLFGVAYNVLLMYLRTQGRWSDRFELGEVSVEAMLDSPSVQVAGRERAGVLLASLRQLPCDLQTTVELYYWEELSIEQIAAALSVPPGTVKSRLARARDVLRRRLGEAGIADDEIEQWTRELRERVSPPADPA